MKINIYQINGTCDRVAQFDWDKDGLSEKTLIAGIDCPDDLNCEFAPMSLDSLESLNRRNIREWLKDSGNGEKYNCEEAHY